MAITNELLDQLIMDYKKPEDLIGENGLLKQLTKRLLEKAMQAEMTEHHLIHLSATIPATPAMAATRRKLRATSARSP